VSVFARQCRPADTEFGRGRNHSLQRQSVHPSGGEDDARFSRGRTQPLILLIVFQRDVIFGDLLGTNLGHIRFRRVFDAGNGIGLEVLSFFH